MGNVLGPGPQRALIKQWLGEEIKKAGGPKVVALELRRAGYPPGSDKPYSERAVQTWQGSNSHLPPPEILWAISQLNASSQDAVVLEGHLKRSLTERLQDHEGRVAELEAVVAELRQLTGTDHTRLDITAAALVVLGQHAGFDVLGWIQKAHRGEQLGERAEGG